MISEMDTWVVPSVYFWRCSCHWLHPNSLLWVGDLINNCRLKITWVCIFLPCVRSCMLAFFLLCFYYVVPIDPIGDLEAGIQKNSNRRCGGRTGWFQELWGEEKGLSMCVLRKKWDWWFRRLPATHELFFGGSLTCNSTPDSSTSWNTI